MIGENVFTDHLSETFSGAHRGTRGGADSPDDSADDPSEQGTMLHLLKGCHELYERGHGAVEDRALLEREFLHGTERRADDLLVIKGGSAPPEDCVIVGGTVIGVGPRDLRIHAVDKGVVPRAFRRITLHQ